MKLNEILKNVDVLSIQDNKNPEISGITINSKKTYQQCLFAAIPGFNQDGHKYAHEAVKSGAAAVLVERTLELDKKAVQVLVKECRKELPLLCKNFYSDPSKKLKLFGITGTNGKTTTVFLLDSILKSAGLKTSFITTVKAEITGKEMAFDRTTPESCELNDFFSRSISEGAKASCMEVSSHSIDLHRVDWLDFDIFVFTNLTQDHLDYHKDMDNYFEVKKRLFTGEFRKLYSGTKAAINIDDLYGKKLAKNTDLELFTYAINDGTADLRAVNIASSIDGIQMDIIYNPAGHKNFKIKKFSIKSGLCGFFNVYNILAAVTAALLAGIDEGSISTGIANMNGVSGRFEKIKLNKNIYAIADYAHTPDGLQSVLKTAKSLLRLNSKLISVFGCGGDRDTKKRKIMGDISASIADFSIITSDNPRSEDPAVIINMIKEGFSNHPGSQYIVEADRREAIYKALRMAEQNDIVLIAGKGHENYQEFKGKRIHFSDQEIVREWAAIENR